MIYSNFFPSEPCFCKFQQGGFADRVLTRAPMKSVCLATLQAEVKYLHRFCLPSNLDWISEVNVLGGSLLAFSWEELVL